MVQIKDFSLFVSSSFSFSRTYDEEEGERGGGIERGESWKNGILFKLFSPSSLRISYPITFNTPIQWTSIFINFTIKPLISSSNRNLVGVLDGSFGDLYCLVHFCCPSVLRRRAFLGLLLRCIESILRMYPVWIMGVRGKGGLKYQIQVWYTCFWLNVIKVNIQLLDQCLIYGHLVYWFIT